MRSLITTHVLDTARGKPAVGVDVILESYTPTKEWKELARGKTDADGRIIDLLPESVTIVPGTYRLTFLIQEYFRSTGQEGFYPYIPVVFRLAGPVTHYHVPLLVSPYGYSTYRGS